MRHPDGEVIQSLSHPSGHRMVQIIRRPDGSARFVEYAIGHTPDTGDYWTPAFIRTRPRPWLQPMPVWAGQRETA